ncbi:putative transposable element encoded protein [Trachipleistophora hominis]|uniref:Putative transposable element encoded protein n=1 Tax=Trachipleistophora hominis TaxID=72359 RepID=L7JS39_TRAHO|nr:putative transposable element encoded protein [Trachipleistophora hominis]
MNIVIREIKWKAFNDEHKMKLFLALKFMSEVIKMLLVKSTLISIATY